MTREPLSPELVLVDPELGARARAALPDPRPAFRAPSAPSPTIVPSPVEQQPVRAHGYPFWARVTAALWLIVLGMLIGGAAIPHAQDRPRLVPPDEEVPAAVCPRPDATP